MVQFVGAAAKCNGIAIAEEIGEEVAGGFLGESLPEQAGVQGGESLEEDAELLGQLLYVKERLLAGAGPLLAER